MVRLEERPEADARARVLIRGVRRRQTLSPSLAISFRDEFRWPPLELALQRGARSSSSRFATVGPLTSLSWAAVDSRNGRPATRWISGLGDSRIDAVRRAPAHRRGHRRDRQVPARWARVAGAPRASGG